MHPILIVAANSKDVRIRLRFWSLHTLLSIVFINASYLTLLVCFVSLSGHLLIFVGNSRQPFGRSCLRYPIPVRALSRFGGSHLLRLRKTGFMGSITNIYKLYRQTLVDLGCSIFDVPIDAFVPPDIVRISTLTRDIRAFRPELAIGDGVLRCQMPPEHDGWRPNFFTEVLGLSTICFWDHAPLELASALLTPLPEHPSASRAGAYAYLQRALTHERLLHCSFDTGQTRLMERLGFVIT